MFVAIGIWMANTAQDTFIGLVGLACIGFFGLGVVVLTWSLRRPNPLTFTPQGLWIAGMGSKKLVEWTNVDAIGITTYQGGKYNMLRLRDPARFMPDDGNVIAQLGTFNRKWWGGEVAIPWSQRDRSAEEFDRLLQLWRAKYG